MDSSLAWQLTSDAVPTLRWVRAGAGILAAVSTRRGGVSPAPWDSLNLGRSVGDDEARVDANRDRLLASLGASAIQLVRIHQVHGGDILDADAPSWPDTDAGPRPHADGTITARRDRLLVITIADCAPVFVTHGASGTLAAVHAGWRGTVAGIAARAVRRVAEGAGVRPADVRAAVGPSIGPCCFEVGAEVVAALPTCEVPQAGGGRSHVNLWQANRDQLRAAGVLAENIDVAGLCTMCRRDLFFSHRRDAGRTGRMIALLGRVG